jgi:hypothetical protein
MLPVGRPFTHSSSDVGLAIVGISGALEAANFRVVSEAGKTLLQ